MRDSSLAITAHSAGENVLFARTSSPTTSMAQRTPQIRSLKGGSARSHQNTYHGLNGYAQELPEVVSALISAGEGPASSSF
jgi:hypothetical protein